MCVVEFVHGRNLRQLHGRHRFDFRRFPFRAAGNQTLQKLKSLFLLFIAHAHDAVMHLCGMDAQVDEFNLEPIACRIDMATCHAPFTLSQDARKRARIHFRLRSDIQRIGSFRCLVTAVRIFCAILYLKLCRTLQAHSMRPAACGFRDNVRQRAELDNVIHNVLFLRTLIPIVQLS